MIIRTIGLSTIADRVTMDTYDLWRLVIDGLKARGSITLETLKWVQSMAVKIPPEGYLLIDEHGQRWVTNGER